MQKQVPTGQNKKTCLGLKDGYRTSWHKKNCPNTSFTFHKKLRSEAEKARKLCSDPNSPQTTWHKENCLRADSSPVYKKQRSNLSAEKARRLCSDPNSPQTTWHKVNCLRLRLRASSPVYRKPIPEEDKTLILHEGDRIRTRLSSESSIDMEVFHSESQQPLYCTMISPNDTFEVIAFNATITDEYPFYAPTEIDQEENHNIIVKKIEVAGDSPEDTACPNDSYTVLPVKCASRVIKGEVPSAGCSVRSLNRFFSAGFLVLW